MTTPLLFTDYFALSPLLILFAASLCVLCIDMLVKEAKTLLTAVALGGFLLAIGAATIAPPSTNPLLTPWIKFDQFSSFFALLFSAIGAATVLIASPFFKQFGTSRAEFYFFLFASVFGLLLVSAANDLLTIFLGIETLSLALYVLCGYVKTWKSSHEASFKYFLLGSISTSFFLFGIALVYGAVGTTRLDSLPPLVRELSQTNGLLFMSGISFITLSLLFKAAVVPFHIWAPDVYAGAPSPVVAFMAVGTKAGAFAALMRLFLVIFPAFDPTWHKAIALLAYPTLLYANFVALRQTNLRRFFAYSGISHAGFLLIPLAAGTPEALPSMLFYLVIYSVATLGSFALISFVDDTSDGVSLTSLKGLFYKSPIASLLLSLCLLTLGGIPPTIGFFAKFYVLKVGFTASLYGLVVVGLLTTILSAYYYLRIVAALFAEKNEKEMIRSKGAWAIALCLASALVLFSFFPESLFSYFTTYTLENRT